MFRNHPPGLITCFAVELWERFSYYGMRALLIFFLTQHLLFADGEAYLIYGAYTAMVYMMAVVGGSIADRYLGARKAVMLGAVLLTLGHFTLAFEGPAASRVMIDGVTTVVRDEFHVALFYLSLAAIVTGVGFLKTGSATLVGALYGPDDPRRDSGFTIYYMGINIGGAAAPLLCGWVGHVYGFGYGFGLAGIGMLIGLFAFARGQKHLQGLAEPPTAARLDAPVLGAVRREWLIYAASLVMVALVWLVLRNQQFVGALIGTVGVAVSGFVIYFAFFRCTQDERDRLIACGILLVFTVGFWAFYEQMGTSLNVFADRYVDRVVLGYEIPAPMLQSLPSIFVILLAPSFSVLWLALARRGREPSTASKFAAAILFVSLAFLLLASAAWLAGADARVSLIWFVLTFLLLVLGELCLAPVAQSMVARLAPRRIMGLMMGCFLFFYSASSFISGLIAQLTAADGVLGRAGEIEQQASVYCRLGLTALAVVLLLLAFRPLLKRLSHEVIKS